MSLLRKRTDLPASVFSVEYEIEAVRKRFFNSMEAMEKSQTIAQKVFLSETLKADTLFHCGTGTIHSICFNDIRLGQRHNP